MAIPKQINEVVTEWYEARNSRDAKRMSQVYAEDAILILPDGRFVRGIDAIREQYQDIFDKNTDKARNLTFKERQYVVHENIAHLISLADTAEGEQHSFLDVFTRESHGTFKFAFSSWTISPR